MCVAVKQNSNAGGLAESAAAEYQTRVCGSMLAGSGL
jgi:hypothetical protein